MLKWSHLPTLVKSRLHGISVLCHAWLNSMWSKMRLLWNKGDSTRWLPEQESWQRPKNERLIYQCKSSLCLHVMSARQEDDAPQPTFDADIVKCGQCGSDVEIFEVTEGLTDRLMEVWRIYKARSGRIPARLEDYG